MAVPSNMNPITISHHLFNPYIQALCYIKFMASIKVFAILIFTILFTFPGIALAAPNVTITPDRNRQFVNINFTDLTNVSRLNYTLVYDTNRGQRGLAGGVKYKSRVRKSSRRQILGTCSSGRCVYHQGIKNLSVEATFYYRNGGSSTVTRLLP